MKVEKFYDICCENCYCYLSTDYDTGFALSREQAIAWAKEKGFRDLNGRTLCPDCLKRIKEYVKLYENTYSK